MAQSLARRVRFSGRCEPHGAASALAIALCVLVSCGCVEREIAVDSAPQGALVHANDQEIGRTPFERNFTWYGTYDVTLRAEGYETLKTEAKVIAPIWQWPPFDLLAELLPFTLRDVHKVHLEMKPESRETVDPQQLAERGITMRGELESSTITTQPAK